MCGARALGLGGTLNGRGGGEREGFSFNLVWVRCDSFYGSANFLIQRQLINFLLQVLLFARTKTTRMLSTHVPNLEFGARPQPRKMSSNLLWRKSGIS